MTRPLILHCLDGLGIGGAERQLILLLRHVPRELFTHAVCHLGPRQDMAPGIEMMAIPVFDLSGGKRMSPLALVRLLRLISRLRPALIHADHDLGKLYGGMAGGLLRVPVLATMGNTIPEPVLPPSSPARDPGMKVRLLGWIQGIVSDHTVCHYMAVNHAVKQSLTADGVPPTRISVVYRGIDLTEFVPDPPERLAHLRRALALENAGPVLINVGRLADQKGQDTIIRAMPAIARVHPHVRLLLVGEGPNREPYGALAEREGMAGNVQLLGTRHDVRELLQLADVFVFPSKREGAAGALLEAMVLARPCVASRIPALEEVVGESGAGVLVPPGRPDLFAEAVLALLADPMRREAMGRQARKLVEQRFDIRSNALEFAGLCTRLINAGCTRRPAEAIP